MSGFAGGCLGEVAALLPSARRLRGAAGAIGHPKLLDAFGAMVVRSCFSAAGLLRPRRGRVGAPAVDRHRKNAPCVAIRGRSGTRTAFPLRRGSGPGIALSV